MRASSSGRAIELLGQKLPQFVGFTAVENYGGFMPVVPGFVTAESIADEDSPLSENHKILLKKMTKKDPTTKVKALQEFSELVSQIEDAVVFKALLPFWPRLYTTLSTDVDHRVREATQKAHSTVVTKAGKSIAPFLRQLCPAWISSHYDTYAPASSAAVQSFQKAFSAAKQQEVFMFCENEILEYFVRNLTQHTAQTLCNPKTHTPEECEAKFERVLISSLHGYALYLEKLPKDIIESVTVKNVALIENPKFWNMHKHKVPAVRAGFFKVVSAILEFATVFVGACRPDHQKSFVANIFQYMDDEETTVVPHVWASIILIQQRIENWQNHLNMEKAVMPKLWRVLKSGGFGMACVIFPNLLPLISKFDKTILGEQLPKFQVLFFENLNTGLREVQASRAETTAIATAYYECLQFVVIQLQNDPNMEFEEKLKIGCKLLDDHLIAVIYWCMNADTTAGRYIFGPLTSLLNFWNSGQDGNRLYEELSKRFWTELYRCIEGSLEMDKNIEKVTVAHVELVQNLKQSAHQRRRQAKVKFSEVQDETDAPTDATIVTASFDAQLTQLIHQICLLYVEKATETKLIAYVQQLDVLLRDKDIQSLALFKHLAGDGNVAQLFDVFAGWLDNPALRCEAVVEIILVLYKFLGAEEKVNLLNTWIKTPIKSVQSWIILRALSHPLCNEPTITKLLAQPEVTDHLLESARQVTRGVFKENLNLLHKCFFQQENGDILIDRETCVKIVEIMSLPLTDESLVEAVDTCGSFLSQIMPVICSTGGGEDASLQTRMFASLFVFSVNGVVSEDLTQDTLYEISTCWQDALSSEDITLTDQLLETCANTINQKLFSPNELQTPIENIEHLAELTAKLILCATENVETDRLAAVDKIVDHVLNRRAKDYKVQAQLLNQLASYVEVLNGALTAKALVDDSTVAKFKFDAAMDQYFTLSLFKLTVIFKLSCNVKKRERPQAKEDEEMEDEDEELTEDFCNSDESLLKVWSDEIYDQMLECVEAAALSDTILYNTSNLTDNFESLFLALQERLTLLLKNISDTLATPLKSKLFVCANKTGLMWSKSLIYLLNVGQYSDAENGAILLYEDSGTNEHGDDVNMMGYINILQVLAKKIPANSLPILPNLFENYFDLTVKLAATRSLVWNHFTSNFNEIQDRKIIGNALILINEMMVRQKEKPFLLYNQDLSAVETTDLLLVSEIANFLADVIRCFPTEIDLHRWDFIRIALSSWSLSVSKSWPGFASTKIAIFMASIYRLFAALTQFVAAEKTKSSTADLSKMIEEWENVFAKDVNLVLLKTYINMISDENASNHTVCYFLDAISPQIGTIDCNYVLKTGKVDGKTSLNDLILWCLRHLSNNQHSVRIACGTILKKLTNGLIAKDMEAMLKRNERNYDNNEDDTPWHIFHQFEPTIMEHNDRVRPFIETFTFKPNDGEEMDKADLLSYLLLWDSVLEICGRSPPELRSIYARWITDHQYEQIFLPTLFKLMPVEILKNPEIGFQRSVMFSKMDAKQILDQHIPLDRYACHLYAQTLRNLPALVRKWWHGNNTRQAGIVEKITTNFVSAQLCQEEFHSLIERKDKQDNMHVTVYAPARQISATYTMDELAMELLITLPVNYPLGAVKVETGKQIGGRIQARQVIMQLSIFLTHQNGNLWDGLSLWKRNLDRKFEGVEECYVCYAVIHQETVQLPRLSCRTCKKKFHSTCLYRWFSTSNKSTCPICRNIF